MKNKEKFNDKINAEYIEPCSFKENELVEVSDDNLDWRLRHFVGMSDNEDYPYIVYASGYTSEDICGTFLYKYCRKYGTLGGYEKIFKMTDEEKEQIKGDS